MSKSILMHENGGPETMKLEDVEVGKPGPGQVSGLCISIANIHTYIQYI